MTRAKPSALRSRIMRAVKSKDTTPELYIRRLLHAKGFRYRLHRTDLPGCPDLVFARLKKVIFIHGCFWHGHNCRRGARMPKSNVEYWTAKISRNHARDQKIRKQLKADGWDVLVVWECRMKAAQSLDRIIAFLERL